MSHADFLVEIGTEELPPRALPGLSQAFSAGILVKLREHSLDFDSAESFATPRRLALLVRKLQLQGDEQTVEMLGPPADKAQDEQGNWTDAARGFARKQGVATEKLETLETDKGPRLALRSTREGVRAADLLPELINESLKNLPIARRMRWGTGRTEFVRPVHWVVALLGGTVLDCEILGLRSGNTSRGHRFHGSGGIELASPADYVALLEEQKVIASFPRRRERIRSQVETEAGKLGASAVIDEELLDEVTALVEWPVALTGRFEERFLEIPAEALVYSMREHQKYFHLEDSEGRLLPNFITISNIESTDPGQVIDGNERVIRPRLSDADFFYNSDRKNTLASRVESLKSVVFQQKLGTLYDKTQRLVALSAYLSEFTGADSEQARRAAELAKTDLLTLMVGEFANMQGTAGRYYALNDGEAPAVADALQQQYWPRFAGDALPDNPVAGNLALADRLDTIVGIFGIGQPPTGSKDPFALRRASLGVLRILVEGELNLDLRAALQVASEQYPAGTLLDNTVDQVMAYMIERFRAWYEDEAIATEVFNAVAAKQLSVPLDIHRRVHAVEAFSRLPQAAALAAANKRVSNLLVKQGSDFIALEVSKDLLTEAAERKLAALVLEQQEQTTALLDAGDYTGVLASLATLQAAVDQFFDAVLVMAEEENLRNNRLNLLRTLRELFLQVADISHLVVSGK